MCGIAGIIGSSEVLPIAEILSSMGHRGPDSSGFFVDDKNKICLLHTRLAVVDLSSNAKQPMSIYNEAITISYNGEIYNYQELRLELEENGFSFFGNSDTEVVVKAYAYFGIDFLQKINGMFALAIWDRSKQRLLIARDSSGIKPLYYSIHNGVLKFASEIKSLLPMIKGGVEINRGAISKYLSFLWCPGPETPVMGVKKLGPGEQIIWQLDKPLKVSRWHIKNSSNYIKARSVAEISSILSRELEESVRRQLQADVPVGGLLSGGLDSSSLMVFAKKLDPKILCYTVEFEGENGNEFSEDLKYADKIATHLKVNLRRTLITSEDYAKDFENFVYQLDEPLADPAAFNVKILSNNARKDGVKVLLSGIGGDELFGGYRRHTLARFTGFSRFMSRFAHLRDSSMLNRFDNENIYIRRFNRLVTMLNNNEDEKSLALFLWASKSQVTKLFSQKFRNEVFKSDIFLPMKDFINGSNGLVSDFEKTLALDSRFFLADHNLNYSDKMSMAEGVELRLPFLDSNVVDFADSLPGKFKQRFFQNKWILKKAMEPYLPKEVIYRKKIGFGAPLNRWLNLEMRELIEKHLCPANIKRRGMFDPQEVANILKDHADGTSDYSYLILSLLTLEVWCQKFLDIRPGYCNS